MDGVRAGDVVQESTPLSDAPVAAPQAYSGALRRLDNWLKGPAP